MIKIPKALNLPKRNEVNSRKGVAGSTRLVGKRLKEFAVGLEGIMVEKVSLNGEAFTPVVFGGGKPATLESAEQGETGFDLSTQNSVIFSIDDVLKTEITFAQGDIIEDNTSATAEEVKDFMLDAIATAEEDSDYSVYVEGEGEKAKVVVYSLNEDLTDSKVEIAEEEHQNTVLEFNNGDIDYGEQGVGEDIVDGNDYIIIPQISDQEDANENVVPYDIQETGFKLLCSDNTKDYEVRLLIVANVE